ncbi:MAG: hypothetical protein M0Z34_07000 [Nitrospiraceae bacterium]|nr:hypothetical protein [Nitrospiraceae bacterium]
MIALSPADIRSANFDDTFEFYAPGLKSWQTSEWKPTNPRRFLPVSVTGSACALSCDHCQTKVLQGMLSVPFGETLFDVAARLQAGGSQGLLISGGSTKNGGVPLERHLRHVPRIKEELGMTVIAHSGVVSPRLAEALAGSGVDGVMLDIIGAEETIRDVYHLDLTPSDFDASLSLLSAGGLRIIPHIILGLHYGRFLGEHAALEMISRYPVSTLILVVLTPLVSTPMENVEPPSVGEISGFFADARTAMPTTRINLGCARPMGGVKSEIDAAAVDLGLNGMAYPAEGTIAYAASRGLTPKLYEWCCSMSWAGSIADGLTEVAV